MGKLWPGGHMQPTKLFNPARQIKRIDNNSDKIAAY